MNSKFLTYGKLIVNIDEIVSINLGKSPIEPQKEEMAVITKLKDGTIWTTTCNSDDELLKTFGDIQKALGAIGETESDLTMEDILSGKSQS